MRKRNHTGLSMLLLFAEYSGDVKIARYSLKTTLLEHQERIQSFCALVFGSSCTGMVGIPIMSVVHPGGKKGETLTSQQTDNGQTDLAVTQTSRQQNFQRNGSWNIVGLCHRNELRDEHETRHCAMRPLRCAQWPSSQRTMMCFHDAFGQK